MLERRSEGSDTGVGDARVGEGREGVTGGAQGGTLRAGLPALLRSPVGPLLIAAGPTIIYTILCLLLFFILRRRIPRIYSPKSINPLYRCVSVSAISQSSKSYLPRWYCPHLASHTSNTRDGLRLATSQFFNHNESGEPRSALCSCRRILDIHWQVPYHIEPDRSDQILVFVLYILWREHLYYINLRHLYLSQSGYYERRTSRTILITSIPEHCLNEKVFQKLFGHSFVQCWIPRASGRLKKLVKKREKRAQQLQEEEVALINEGNRGRPSQLWPSLPSFTWMRQTRSNEPDVEKVGLFQRRAPKAKDVDVQSGEVQISSHESSNLAFEPPSPEPGKIESTRSALHLLNQKIDKLRQEYDAGQGKHMNAAFIEFDSFANTQAAFQSVPQHQPFQMCRQVMGVKPGEIVWSSLRIKWWERLLREFVVAIVIGGCVIVWIMPIALVEFVTSAPMVGRVDGVSELPQLAVNAISGLGRALLLWILLEFVPFLMRICAKFAGVTTLTGIEHFVHKRYFIFQTLQIFLGPMIRPTPITFFSNIPYLNQQVPEASILYMSYILVRCLSAGATELIQLWQLFLNMTRRKRPGTPPQAYFILVFLRYGAWGQFSLLVLLAVFTIFIHLSLRKAMNPRIENFSTLDNDDASKRFHPSEDYAARGVDQYGSSSYVATSTETLRDLPSSSFNNSFWNTQKKVKHRMWGSWFRTAAFGDFQHAVSPDHTEDEFMALYGSSCYQPPETWLPKPKLWLPEDGAMRNYLEAPDIQEPLSIAHDGAQVDEKGRVKFDLELSPFHDDLLFYRHLHLIL
ncbi:DUF221 domain-containing protein [Fusarium phyllophilum]|uniref:DUF221 domain-containing protein n=1 Tax=Fusarium phyllophilum TaxID=47803 RepID=A0A8H5NGR4_9HYPO|nr:DUF221 domain-containing protein [Fusarium phyllophilum]